MLLFGMMVLVAHLRLAGGLAALAKFVNERVTHPAVLLLALVLTVGTLSALFVNDTICLVFTPIVIDVARGAQASAAAVPAGARNGLEHRQRRDDHWQSAEHAHRHGVGHFVPRILGGAARRLRLRASCSTR